MAKYTVAVCDDEKEDLSFLVRKITEYDTHQLFEIKTYTDGELLFDELKSQKTSIDLLLLDIDAIQWISTCTNSTSFAKASNGDFCN